MRTARILVGVALALLVRPTGAVAEEDGTDLHYDLVVQVNDANLAVTETIRGGKVRGPKLTLELVPEMRVRSVEAEGKALAYTTGKGQVQIDRGGRDAAPAEGITLRLEGAPREQFSAARGGWVRSAIGPDLAYIRSQVPWYARLSDALATYRTTVHVKSGWKVCTAGVPQPVAKGDDRDTYVFETKLPEPRIGLVAGPFASREVAAGEGGRFEALHLSAGTDGPDAILGVAGRAFDFYGGWLGQVAFERFTLVEMPEAFGASSGYGESGYILLGPAAFASPPASFAASLVAHEVSHTWWGHAVMFSEWPSEALACFATMKFLEADQGTEAGCLDRRSAVEEVLRAVAADKEVALDRIRGFGGGMDPETYASHAYGKGKMLLVMVEDAIGEDAMKRLLAQFAQDNQGKTVGWSDLRAVLVQAGPAAKTVVEQWEQPGVPSLSLEIAKPAKPGRLKGTVRQEGTRKPFKMKVLLAATCGDQTTRATVALDGAKASFDLSVPSEPSAIEIDPEWRLLVARPATSGVDPSKAFEEGMTVANNPGQRDPKILEEAIAKLRLVLERGSPDQAGTCHVGIGRCLFNLERLDDARKELEEGLRLGCGPFHRAWANLRLGNIADLQNRRKDALRLYETVLSGPAAKNLEFVKGWARRFSESPYRSVEADG